LTDGIHKVLGALPRSRVKVRTLPTFENFVAAVIAED
jgi:hypothetical protein